MYKLSLDDFDDIISTNKCNSDYIESDPYIEDHIKFDNLINILKTGILSPEEYEEFMKLSKKYKLKMSCGNQKNLMETIKCYNIYKKQQKYKSMLVIKK